MKVSHTHSGVRRSHSLASPGFAYFRANRAPFLRSASERASRGTSIPNALFIVIALFTFTSFSSPRRAAVELPAPIAEIDPQNPNIIRRGGVEYSASTVIVSVAENATDAHIADLASRHELEIVYTMQNLHIVVLRTAEPQSPEALDALIAALKAEPLVLTAEKDHIIRLDDPVERRQALRENLHEAF